MDVDLLLPQVKSPSGAWLFLVPRNTADNTTINGIITSSTLGALGTIEWNGTNPWTGAPITDRSSLAGHRWRFVEYIQPATTYETRGTAYTRGEDVLATMCVSYGVVPGAFYFKLSPNRLPPLATPWPFSGVDDPFAGQVFYLDQAFSIPATTPPTGLDTVVMSGTGNVDMFTANLSAGWAGTLIVRGNVNLQSQARAINIASAIFYDNTSVGVGFIASGAMTFNNHSTSGASHEAQLITLNDYASSGGLLKANVVMNGCSQNSGSIDGNVTLNDHAVLMSGASGTITNNSDGQCP